LDIFDLTKILSCIKTWSLNTEKIH